MHQAWLVDTGYESDQVTTPAELAAVSGTPAREVVRLEAVAVLRRSLLPNVAAALADFEDESRLPPVRPSFNERELDAALRQLHHAVDLTADTTIPTAAPTRSAQPRQER